MMRFGKIKIAVFISGGGSNLEAILEAIAQGQIEQAEVAYVLSNKANAGGLEKAARYNVPAEFIDPKVYATRADYFAEVLTRLQARQIDLICLAGFLLKLEPNLIAAFRGRILNIHPALLPRFGGPGMYGHHVHEAVLAAGEKESGCTVHLVDEELDHGAILAQLKAPVKPDDTADLLAARVLKLEHRLYPAAIVHFIRTQFFAKDEK